MAAGQGGGDWPGWWQQARVLATGKGNGSRPVGD